MTAQMLTLHYPHDGRKLQRLIIALLKQGLAYSIKRINYTKSYRLVEGKMQRTEEKIVIIKTNEQKKQRLMAFLSKQHPEALEYTRTSSEEIDDAYKQRTAL